MTSATSTRRRGLTGHTTIKSPVIAASTANLTLSAEQTVDGIALVAGDRVLVKDQTDGTENGIYLVATSTWAREPDWDGVGDVVEGTMAQVNRGTINALTWWLVSNTGTITPGTTDVTFVQGLTDVGISATSTVTDESSDTTCFPVFMTAATGNNALKSGSNLTFNSSTGDLAPTKLTATTITGTTITGTTIDGTVGSVTPAAATVTTLAVNGDITTDADGTDSIGATAKRWLKGWFDSLTVTGDVGAATGTFTGEVTGTGFTGTLDGILGGGTPAAATVTTLTATTIAGVYAGSIPVAGTTVVGNSGFTCAKGGTGIYILTHSLNSTIYGCTGNADNQGDVMVSAALGVNAVTFSVRDSAGSLEDNALTFILINL